MEFIKLFFTVVFLTCLGCAKNFNPVISEISVIEEEKFTGQSFLDGEFVLENGEVKSLADLSNKSLLIFFVGEFCESCFKETKKIKEMIRDKGLPPRLNMISVMIGVGPQIITQWVNDIEPFDTPLWILGSDEGLRLYGRYFDLVKTPSILYFNPQTQILKRWQTGIDLKSLEQETELWY